MADMYGIPVGISASDADARQNLQSGLQAQKMLGEIAQQPDAARLTRAHADLYEAQAKAALEKAREQEKLSKLAEAFAARGQTATVEDAQKVQGQAGTFGVEQMEAFADLALKSGIDPMTVAGLYDKTASVAQKRAAAANSASNEQVHKINTSIARAERVGSLALAGLQGPQQYAQARMVAAQEGLPINFPESWAQARPMLQGLVMQGMKAKEQLELQRKEIEDAAQRKLWTSTEVRNYASANAAGARAQLAQERADQLRKAGGPNGKEMTEAQKSADAARKRKAEADARKEFPPMPIDPESPAFEVGKSFTDRQGRRLTMVGRDSRGMPTFELAKAATVPDYSKEQAAVDDYLDEED